MGAPTRAQAAPPGGAGGRELPEEPFMDPLAPGTGMPRIPQGTETDQSPSSRPRAGSARALHFPLPDDVPPPSREGAQWGPASQQQVHDVLWSLVAVSPPHGSEAP